MDKLNILEADLLKESVGWIYNKYHDKLILEVVNKTSHNKEDLEILKDAIEKYHRAGGIRGIDRHTTMKSIFGKMGKSIKSTFEREREVRKKREEEKRKKAEKLEKAELARKQKEVEKRIKEEVQEKDLQIAREAKLKKAQFNISDIQFKLDD